MAAKNGPVYTAVMFIGIILICIALVMFLVIWGSNQIGTNYPDLRNPHYPTNFHDHRL